MSSKKYDLAVFIARAQLPHKGHLKVIREGLKQAKRVLILLGSENASISSRNPFPVERRYAMLKNLLEEGEIQVERPGQYIYPGSVGVEYLPDILYCDPLWIAQIQSKVLSHSAGDIALLGYKKDHTSYYLNLFPYWGEIGVAPEMMDEKTPLSSTYLRDTFLFSTDQVRLHGTQEIVQWTGESVAKMLDREVNKRCVFRNRTIRDIVQSEIEFAREYQAPYKGLPYPPVFTAVDAVVIQSGHVLMIERKDDPGRGLLALPGGFIKPNETLFEASMRELLEETGLKVPDPVLRGSYRAHREFDSPLRSIRGRTITHAFVYKLNDSHTMPRIKAGDDAKKAMWMPIGGISPRQVYEDHHHIKERMIARLEN